MDRAIILAILVSMATNAHAVGVGGECDSASDCTTTNQQSTCRRLFTTTSCSKGDCQCNSGYGTSSCTAVTTKAQYGQACTANSDCDTDYTCTSSLCACATSTYTYKTLLTKCIDPTKKVYGETCSQTSDCYNGGASGSITCATTCKCSTGYLYNNAGGCILPKLDEACSTSPGCDNTFAYGSDSSLQSPSCTSSVCACPSSSTKYSVTMGDSSSKYCLTTTTATLKTAGTTCTTHNQCESKLCYVCPGDSTSTKRCLHFQTNGGPGIQATTGLLLALIAVTMSLFE